MTRKENDRFDERADQRRHDLLAGAEEEEPSRAEEEKCLRCGRAFSYDPNNAEDYEEDRYCSQECEREQAEEKEGEE